MADPIIEVKQVLSVPYNWSYGKQLTEFFNATKKKILLGTRCKKCDVVIVPASDSCTLCFGHIEEPPFQVSDHGRIESYTIVYLPWPGQPTEPPYCMCTVKLDGCDTHFMHITGEMPFDKIKCDMRVQAVWNPKRRGDLYDIKYFKPEVGAPPKVKIPGRAAKSGKPAKNNAAKKDAKPVSKALKKAKTIAKTKAAAKTKAKKK